MSTPRAFISFDFDNDHVSRMLFTGQGKSNSPTTFTEQDWSSKTPLPQDEWENLLAAKINSCHLMIVLVGKYMSTATGVTKEIKFTQAANVPFFGIYVNGADERSTLPIGLSRSRVLQWRWPTIGAAVERMMREGKNS